MNNCTNCYGKFHTEEIKHIGYARLCSRCYKIMKSTNPNFGKSLKEIMEDKQCYTKISQK